MHHSLELPWQHLPRTLSHFTAAHSIFKDSTKAACLGRLTEASWPFTLPDYTRPNCHTESGLLGLPFGILKKTLPSTSKCLTFIRSKLSHYPLGLLNPSRNWFGLRVILGAWTSSSKPQPEHHLGSSATVQLFDTLLHSAFILYKLLESKNLTADTSAIGMTFTSTDVGGFSFSLTASTRPGYQGSIFLFRGPDKCPRPLEKGWPHRSRISGPEQAFRPPPLPKHWWKELWLFPQHKGHAGLPQSQ